MLIRSGKIQFLFWTSFFSVLLYLWIVVISLQTFVLPDEAPMELLQETIRADVYPLWFTDCFYIGRDDCFHPDQQ
jgi:hypothetical protein